MGAKIAEKTKIIFFFRQDRQDNPVNPAQALGWVNLVNY
jgi:hypothetical protein